MQAVGEMPEQHRGARPMDVDASTSAQENTAAQPGTAAQPADGGADAPAKEQPGWRKRGLRVLNAPHTRPPDHEEIVRTIQDGNVADWDAWECLVHDAVRCAALLAHSQLSAL